MLANIHCAAVQGIAAHAVEVEVNDGRSGWRRTGAAIETQGEFSDQWRSDIAGGAKHILELGNVTISDEHYDS